MREEKAKMPIAVEHQPLQPIAFVIYRSQSEVVVLDELVLLANVTT
jgi:hypothetical protein